MSTLTPLHITKDLDLAHACGHALNAAGVSSSDCDAECGVYPRDTTNRFITDYQAIYQTPATPNLRKLLILAPFLA